MSDGTAAGDAERAFPVVYVRDVAASAEFYALLGFEATYRHPPDGEAGYVAMRRGTDRLGVTTVESPRGLLGIEPGGGARFELFVYVRGVEAAVQRLRTQGVTVLREPADMPWGERLAYVADPDGNPVVLAEPPP